MSVSVCACLEPAIFNMKMVICAYAPAGNPFAYLQLLPIVADKLQLLYSVLVVEIITEIHSGLGLQRWEFVTPGNSCSLLTGRGVHRANLDPEKQTKIDPFPNVAGLDEAYTALGFV